MSTSNDSSNEDEENLMEIRERNIRILKQEFQQRFGSESEEIGNKLNRNHNGKKIFKVTKKQRVHSSRGFNESVNTENNIAQKNQLSRMPKIRLNLASREVITMPDDVTEEMLQQISYKSVGKKYDALRGTTCHQCRQKTMDIKSICRNRSCTGRRGQFCGFCLRKRYGENLAEVLKDPMWKCPVCRNICNCSLCRAKLGKRPTGVLVPIAEKNGFKSVKDFLDNNSEQNNEI